MLVPGANITGLAKRLQKDGFIVKKSDERDERVTILEITPKGKRTLKYIEKEKDEWLAAAVKIEKLIISIIILNYFNENIRNLK
jgi:MarR family 2-MHQ and catechol resistance regulon transcriptional repressor